MREIIDFNKDWKFILEDNINFADTCFDDSNWRKLNLPHDWSIEYPLCEDAPTGGGGGFAKAGICWYRKTFDVSDFGDKDISILFDGVYMSPTVYLNGEKIFSHHYGYTPFNVELSEKLVEGKNVIAVRVDNSHQPNSRWYTGSGIYRNVHLIKTDKVHFDLWGVQYNTNGLYLSRDKAGIEVRANIVNNTGEPVYTGAKHVLYDMEGNVVSKLSAGVYVDAFKNGQCETKTDIVNPHLWTDKDPYLYKLVSTLIVDGAEVDSYSVNVGLRTATFDCDRGFLLNDNSVKIKGMCLHHDCGITGGVGYREVWYRRLKKLKDMGCNGIRCSHNPPTPELLDLCDEMGFLVMDEIFDEWMLGKNKNYNYFTDDFSYGYCQFFKQYAEEDLVKMIRRDYNHPSVILWSVGNEIPEQASRDGIEIVRFLQDICHREDYTRMVTSACDNIESVPEWSATKEFLNSLDVVGYNYVGRWRNRAETFYEEDRGLHPKWRMVGSENPSVGGKRGDYGDRGFFGSYENQTLNNEALWRFTLTHDYVAGDYLWTGIDYLGETRWPQRGAGCGPIDTAGFEKDSYYYFRSIWNDEDITLHILPHWNWEGEEGQFKPVIVYTNCDEVKLYINDKLVGTRGYACPRVGAKKSWNDGMNRRCTTNDLHLSFDVPYEAGELKAVGYVNGEIVAEKIVKTSGSVKSITAVSDSENINTNGLVQIEITALDENGVFVPTADNLIKVDIEGPAHLVGMDSGDLADLTLYSESERKMLAGRLFAIVRAEGKGHIKVQFTGENIESVAVEFDVYE